MLKKIKTAVVALAIGSSGGAFAYTLDGDLNDWLANDSSWDRISGFTPTSGVNGIYVEQDGINGGGGQPYDTELLMADVDWAAGTLYVAVVSGVDPDQSNDNSFTGGSPYYPGDLAIYTDSDFDNPNLWNIKENVIDWNPVSGTTNRTQPSDMYGVSIPDKIHDVNNTGSGDTGQTASTQDVYQGRQWYTQYSRLNSNNEKHITSMRGNSDHGGTQTGSASVIYTTATFGAGSFSPPVNPSAGTHYIIEAAIPLAALGWNGTDNSFNVALQWTMNCANDWIDGAGTFTRTPGTGGGPVSSVPEPAPLAIMALGLVGLGFTRRLARKNS